MIKPITDLTEEELYSKKVLFRVDFNVPVENGRISEIYRIRANKETIDYLTSRGAIVALLSHITAIDGLGPISDQIKGILGLNFSFLPESIGEIVETNLKNAKPGDIFLLGNIRKNEGEEKNDLEFAKKLTKPFDIYVNNAFSVSHRNHASLVAVTNFLPSYAGFLLMKEIDNLSKVLKAPKENKTLVLGGAKIETKLPLIKNFLDKAQNILIGGAIANVFLKAKGVDIQKSLCEDIFCAEAKKLLEENSHIIIPEDYIMAGGVISDIGPKTVAEFIKTINKSSVVIWNGPLGKVENERFSAGSKKILEAIVASDAFSVVGGGDTLAFLEKLGMLSKVGYASTGGGAMIEFLAGKKLPGLEALSHYAG